LDKTATFTFEEALLSPLGFHILSGAGVVDSDKTILHHTVKVQCMAGTNAGDIVVYEDMETTGTPTLTITKDMLPSGATIVHNNPTYPLAKIFVMELDANGEVSKRVKVDNGTGEGLTVDIAVAHSGNNNIVQYSDAGNTALQISGNDLQVGTIYLVDLYCEIDGTELTVEADKFAGYYYIEANTLFRRASDGMDVPAQFTIPKGKIQSNFTFTMAGSGDPSRYCLAS
jgi:hypothetical protein